jgi:hypothetical protein
MRDRGLDGMVEDLLALAPHIFAVQSLISPSLRGCIVFFLFGLSMFERLPQQTCFSFG